MMEKRGFLRKKLLEGVIGENMIWMPYHRIRFSYTRSKRDLIQRYGETGRGETALNAMFCGCVENERELFVLFRPNYLKYEIMKHSPESEEIVGPTFRIDFDGVFGSFLKRLNEVEEKLNDLRSELRKNRVRISRYSHIIPAVWDLKKEKTLSGKVAKLSATKTLLSMCLNVDESMDSIEVAGSDIFYYPILVVALKNKGNGTERFLIVNLVEGGLRGKHLSCDKGLTELCDKNSGCKEIVAGLIAP
ncbi:hypothetical protein GWO13_05485 [Candidatus Bathyarchaeota archaeon]|nr:hypothetical protein [Candidatus Bathyarchaeota archaeon]